MARVTLRISDELYEKLSELAKQGNRPLNKEITARLEASLTESDEKSAGLSVEEIEQLSKTLAQKLKEKFKSID